MPTEPVEPFWRPGNEHQYDGPGRVIGSDDRTVFVVMNDGVVWSMDPSGDVPSRFVNSSADEFVMFLATIPIHREQLVGSDDENAIPRVDRLADELARVDPAALKDPDAFWSVVLEQLRDGLL